MADADENKNATKDVITVPSTDIFKECKKLLSKISKIVLAYMAKLKRP